MSPMEEALQLIGVEENSEGAVSPGGHSEKAAGVSGAAATVIDPPCLEGEAVKGGQMCGVRNGTIGHTLTDEFWLGERVEDGELFVGKVSLEASKTVAVFFKVFEARLIGVVKEALPNEALGAEEIGEFRQELV